MRSSPINPRERSTPVLVDGARSPTGRFRGALRDVPAVALGAHAVRAALARCPGLRPDYIAIGNVLQAANGQNRGRRAAILGGVARDVRGVTLNDVCLASMSSLALGAAMIRAGEADCVLAGGFDSMTGAPHAVRLRTGAAAGNREMIDVTFHDGLRCAIADAGMIELSDNENDRLGLTARARTRSPWPRISARLRPRTAVVWRRRSHRSAPRTANSAPMRASAPKLWLHSGHSGTYAETSVRSRKRPAASSSLQRGLASVPADLFGICVAGTSGAIFAAVDADHEFTIMSVSKPFVFALVCELIGPDAARERLGVNRTGLLFNSLYGVERSADGRTNPMVNAGAIAATSLAAGDAVEAGGASFTTGSRASSGESSRSIPRCTPPRRPRTRATRASRGSWKAFDSVAFV